MTKIRFGAIGAFGLFAAGLFAQGLNTSARPTDWEEINFEFNSSVLSDGYPSLLRLADILKAHPDFRVAVEGHTDYVGSNAYNDKLAMARANEVKRFLVKYGAADGQITTSGQGKRSPETDNRTKEGRFINRRVTLRVINASGQVVSEGGTNDVLPKLEEFMKKQEECCNNILKRLDKLDDILAALRDLKGENDKLKADLADQRNALGALRDQVNAMPKPLTAEQTTTIAQNEGNRVLEESLRRNKKFTLMGLNIGPTWGPRRSGDFTFSGRGQFFSPFGGTGMNAVQAQAEYMYYPGRQEGQFDIGLIHRFDRVQAGLFSSFKYLNFREYQQGGGLGQGAFLVDYLFSRGKIGIFGTKGFKNIAMLNRATLVPGAFLETYARIVDQVGFQTTLGVWGDAYLEGNLGYLKRHGPGSNRPGGALKLVQPLSSQFALTAEFGLNETLLNVKDNGRFVLGFQFGNWLRPKEYLDVKHPVPMDVPRIRYELLTRRVGSAPPVADAGADQIGVPAGTITLNGTGSYDPLGLPLTYQWTQIGGPSVAISNSNAATASFQAQTGTTYTFRLTVKNSEGLSSSARTVVSTERPLELRILNFSANPPQISPGGVATLTWLVQGAQQVTITPGIGNVDAREGRTDVRPGQTTEYVLTATAGSQSIRQSVTVRVQGDVTAPVRILRFEAQPMNINQGEASLLSWATDNATEVTISGIGTVPANGSRSVTPQQTTTYVMTARGASGDQVTSQVIVTVGVITGLPRIVQFASIPASIVAGQTAQLCYNVENGINITISPEVGPVSKQSDCVTVNPTLTTTYTLTATNGAGTQTATTIVNVGNAVRILSFSSDPPFSEKSGDPVRLIWTTENATSVTITGTGVPSGDLPANGSVVVNPITNTNYTLIAHGPNGTSTVSVIQVFVR